MIHARAYAGLFALSVALVPAIAHAGDEPVCTLPAGTHMTFLLDAPLSSSKSKTGETFGFTLVHSIETPACTVDADGAAGTGLVYLAGASGSNGHEGDLTIRPDSLRTADGRVVAFDDQRIEINGRNRKIESAVLGFVPIAGLAAGFIRGSDIHIDEKTPIDTVLKHPATVTRATTTPASPAPKAASGPQREP